MNEFLYINLLKTISLVAGILGVLIGLDLLLGASVTTALKRVLDKYFDFDKIAANRRVQIVIGIMFLIFSLIILLLIKRV